MVWKTGSMRGGSAGTLVRVLERQEKAWRAPCLLLQKFFSRTWGMLFQKRVVHTIFYIYSTFLYFDKTIYNVLVARICGKKLHDRIIFLREEVRTYKTSLIPPHFIEVPGILFCQNIKTYCRYKI
jgi:hypothetical protein